MTVAFWGADANELEQLANSVRAAASELEGIVGSPGTCLASTTWQGPDADVYQSDWHGIHARARGAAVEALRSAASDLDFEARQQVTASGDLAGALGIGAGVSREMTSGAGPLFGGISVGSSSLSDGLSSCGTFLRLDRLGTTRLVDPFLKPWVQLTIGASNQRNDCVSASLNDRYHWNRRRGMVLSQCLVTCKSR